MTDGQETLENTVKSMTMFEMAGALSLDGEQVTDNAAMEWFPLVGRKRRGRPRK